MTLVLPRSILTQGLIDTELANGTQTGRDVVGPVEIRFINRKTVCNAAVLPGGTEVLLGSIPMEDRDVVR